MTDGAHRQTLRKSDPTRLGTTLSRLLEAMRAVYLYPPTAGCLTRRQRSG